jgi:dissimilatory sulfite reductase alpha subunit
MVKNFNEREVTMAKHETPLLDQLESGPWPSFVSDMKQEAAVRAKNEKKH